MHIELELIDPSSRPAVFRLAFLGASERLLLQYPQCYGLHFLNAQGELAAQWGTRFVMSKPLDDFVLTPKGRIAFDLFADINPEPMLESLWSIYLPAGEYAVKYVYQIDRDTDWYDFLAKRSRFADITPIWRGTLESNAVPITIAHSAVQSPRQHPMGRTT